MSIHNTTWSPRRRYSAVAVFSDDLERVVLIHKLKPAWQAGKANFPGGKVEAKDWPPHGCGPDENPDYLGAAEDAYRTAAARELTEETGLVVPVEALTLFCTLRFRSREGDDAECQFFTVKLPCKGSDLDDHVKTVEDEEIFCDWVDGVMSGSLCKQYIMKPPTIIPTMSNLPWLTAMARQTLRGSSATPCIVYEAGAYNEA